MKKVNNVRKSGDLKPKEQRAVDFFVRVLETAESSESAVTFGYLVDNWNKKHYKSEKHQLNDDEGKRIIRYIRDNGLIRRLMADNYGYFIADNIDKYKDYLSILERKIQKLTKTYNALRRQVR